MSGNTNRIRVLVIEHNRILLDGLSRLLSEFADVQLAGSGAAGVALFEQARPSLTVIDLDLPDISATEVVRRIRVLDTTAPILMLATYELDPLGAEAIECGAAAILAKDQISSQLLPLMLRVTGPSENS